MIRAFVAVELPDSLREEIAAVQAKLKTARADVKWVKPENLHLTLKFLGYIADEQVASLKENLAAAVKKIPSFELELKEVGAFPRMTSPRVIWIGTGAGKEELGGLAKTVEEVCTSLGFPAEERPFSAHLTIGRVRSSEGLRSLASRAQETSFTATTPAPIKQVTLFQSVLSPHGSTYTPLAHLPLA